MNIINIVPWPNLAAAFKKVNQLWTYIYRTFLRENAKLLYAHARTIIRSAYQFHFFLYVLLFLFTSWKETGTALMTNMISHWMHDHESHAIADR